MLQGIDVSHWQKSLPSLTKVSFVIVKATEGLTVDPMWLTHCANVRKAGKMLMAYHYSRDDVDITKQANKFLATVRAVGVDGYALDVEGSFAFSAAQARQFNSIIHNANLKIGWYSNVNSYKGDVGQDWNWIAFYSSAPPPVPYDIWQYGPYLGVDGDRYNGTLDDLRALVGGPPVDTFQVLATPMFAVINQGDWIYDNPNLQASSGNTQVSPGPRNMPIAGVLSSGVYIIGYVDTTPTESRLRIMYAKASTKTIPAQAPAPPPIQIPPDETSCKTFSDAAYTKGQTDGIKTGIDQEQTRMKKLLGLP